MIKKNLCQKCKKTIPKKQKQKNRETKPQYFSLKVEIKYKEQVKKFIKKLQKQEEDSFSYDFKRRIVPFYLQKFMKWTQKNKNNTIYYFLANIKKSKVSKQKKFELGDMKTIFNSLKQGELEKEIRMHWISFLQNAEQFCINDYCRIQKNRANYLKGADILIKEMQKERPFEKFLSCRN